MKNMKTFAYDKDYESMESQAIKDYNSKKYDEASPVFQEILKAKGLEGNEELALKLVNCAYKLKNYFDAIYILEHPTIFGKSNYKNLKTIRVHALSYYKYECFERFPSLKNEISQMEFEEKEEKAFCILFIETIMFYKIENHWNKTIKSAEKLEEQYDGLSEISAMKNKSKKNSENISNHIQKLWLEEKYNECIEEITKDIEKIEPYSFYLIYSHLKIGEKKSAKNYVTNFESDEPEEYFRLCYLFYIEDDYDTSRKINEMLIKKIENKKPYESKREILVIAKNYFLLESYQNAISYLSKFLLLCSQNSYNKEYYKREICMILQSKQKETNPNIPEEKPQAPSENKLDSKEENKKKKSEDKEKNKPEYDDINTDHPPKFEGEYIVISRDNANDFRGVQGLQIIKHENILSFKKKVDKTIYMENFGKYTLYGYLRKQGINLNKEKKKSLIEQIINGLKYLKNKRFRPSILDPYKIMVSENGDLKIFSHIFEFYEDNELYINWSCPYGNITKEQYYFYSLGVLIWQIVTNKVPFDKLIRKIKEDPFKQLKEPLSIKDIPDDIPEKILKMMFILLKGDSAKDDYFDNVLEDKIALKMQEIDNEIENDLLKDEIDKIRKCDKCNQPFLLTYIGLSLDERKIIFRQEIDSYKLLSENSKPENLFGLIYNIASYFDSIKKDGLYINTISNKYIYINDKEDIKIENFGMTKEFVDTIYPDEDSSENPFIDLISLYYYLKYGEILPKDERDIEKHEELFGTVFEDGLDEKKYSDDDFEENQLVNFWEKLKLE